MPDTIKRRIIHVYSLLEEEKMISIEVILALLIAFAISVLLSPFVIPFLRKLKIGNTEREEGVQSHLKKEIGRASCRERV